LYMYNSDTDVVQVDKVILNINNNLFFDSRLNMLIHKLSNELFQVIPHHFIGEYSYNTKSIIRFRMDKTNNIYNSIKYKGNSASVINQSKFMFDTNSNISLLALSQILNDSDKYPDDIKIIDTIFSSDNNTQYFYNQTNETNVRTI